MACLPNGLSLDEAAWLLSLNGHHRKSLSRLAMSDDVLDALLSRGSISLTNGIVEITSKGLDEVARLTELTTADPAAIRQRANSLGARVTPVPPSRRAR